MSYKHKKKLANVKLVQVYGNPLSRTDVAKVSSDSADADNKGGLVGGLEAGLERSQDEAEQLRQGATSGNMGERGATAPADAGKDRQPPHEHCGSAGGQRGQPGPHPPLTSRAPFSNITSFYGSSCANNGHGALNTPESLDST
eukprot:4187930-Pyramimonas_sp.AAC.1